MAAELEARQGEPGGIREQLGTLERKLKARLGSVPDSWLGRYEELIDQHAQGPTRERLRSLVAGEGARRAGPPRRLQDYDLSKLLRLARYEPGDKKLLAALESHLRSVEDGRLFELALDPGSAVATTAEKVLLERGHRLANAHDLGELETSWAQADAKWAERLRYEGTGPLFSDFMRSLGAEDDWTQLRRRRIAEELARRTGKGQEDVKVLFERTPPHKLEQAAAGLDRESPLQAVVVAAFRDRIVGQPSQGLYNIAGRVNHPDLRRVADDALRARVEAGHVDDLMELPKKQLLRRTRLLADVLASPELASPSTRESIEDALGRAVIHAPRTAVVELARTARPLQDDVWATGRLSAPSAFRATYREQLVRGLARAASATDTRVRPRVLDEIAQRAGRLTKAGQLGELMQALRPPDRHALLDRLRVHLSTDGLLDIRKAVPEDLRPSIDAILAERAPLQE